MDHRALKNDGSREVAISKYIINAKRTERVTVFTRFEVFAGNGQVRPVAGALQQNALRNNYGTYQFLFIHLDS